MHRMFCYQNTDHRQDKILCSTFQRTVQQSYNTLGTFSGEAWSSHRGNAITEAPAHVFHGGLGPAVFSAQENINYNPPCYLGQQTKLIDMEGQSANCSDSTNRSLKNGQANSGHHSASHAKL